MQTELNVILLMENVTAKMDIVEISVKVFALTIASVKNVLNFVDVKMAENVITFLENVLVQKVSRDHCKIFYFDLLRKYQFVDF